MDDYIWAKIFKLILIDDWDSRFDLPLVCQQFRQVLQSLVPKFPSAIHITDYASREEFYSVWSQGRARACVDLNLCNILTNVRVIMMDFLECLVFDQDVTIRLSFHDCSVELKSVNKVIWLGMLPVCLVFFSLVQVSTIKPIKARLYFHAWTAKALRDLCHHEPLQVTLGGQIYVVGEGCIFEKDRLRSTSHILPLLFKQNWA